jgi:hypothetical protein
MPLPGSGVWKSRILPRFCLTWQLPEESKSNIPCCAAGARNICAHRTHIWRLTFAWHMRQIHAGFLPDARHIRESDANVARTCKPSRDSDAAMMPSGFHLWTHSLTLHMPPIHSGRLSGRSVHGYDQSLRWVPGKSIWQTYGTHLRDEADCSMICHFAAK